MKNVSAAQHQDYDSSNLLLYSGALARIRFWDVGTGNCNALVNQHNEYIIYYDFGGNFKAGGGSRTYPKPTPAFEYDDEAIFIISHWDGDHYYSLKKVPGAGECEWLGTREDIAADGQKLLNSRCTNLMAIPKPPAGEASYTFHTNDTGMTIKLVRCAPEPGSGTSEAIIRNNSGIAMMVYVDTAATLAFECAKEEAAGGGSAADTATAVGALSTDIYKNLVLLAAQRALVPGATAADVVTAAEGALTAAPVKAMAETVIAALRFAMANPGNATGVRTAATMAAGVYATHAYVAPIIAAANAQAILTPANAALTANQAKAQLTLGGTVINAAAVGAVAMMEYAWANPGDKAGTVAAAGPHNNDRYLQVIIGKAQTKANEPASTAADVAAAAVEALSPAPRYKTTILLTGDAAFQAIPGCRDHDWDVLLAFHHGTNEEFTHWPPRPVVPGESAVIYSSGKRGATKVYGHPSAAAIADYRARGWTSEYYTTHGYVTPNHGGGRGAREITFP